MKFIALAIVALVGTTEAIKLDKKTTSLAMVPDFDGYDPDHPDRKEITRIQADFEQLSREKNAKAPVWKYDMGVFRRCKFYAPCP